MSERRNRIYEKKGGETKLRSRRLNGNSRHYMMGLTPEGATTTTPELQSELLIIVGNPLVMSLEMYLLIRDDLPTLGMPMIPTVMDFFISDERV